MNMQDKEFDELFRSKLDDLDVMPAVQVWGNIKGELDASRRRRFILPFLSAAASITVLIAAGIFFIPENNTAGGSKHVEHTNARVKRTEVDSTPVTDRSKGTGANTTLPPAMLTRLAAAHQVKYPAGNTVKNSTTVNRIVIGAKGADAQLLAEAKPNKDVLIPVVPGKETALATVQTPDEQVVFHTQLTQPVARLAVSHKQDTPPVKQKRGIRSLGDIINVVVAQVDKRKDKLIEFTDSDDDESTITGINIGIIKIKKDK